MSKVLEGLKYAKSHEWIKLDGNVATIGITDYAQKSLGAIVYVDAFEVGEEVEQFNECGAVESTKAASDIMSPVSGEIIEVNENVINNPELINQDAYSNWILKIKINDSSELDNLLDSKSYTAEQK